jgi:hypothetical protein
VGINQRLERLEQFEGVCGQCGWGSPDLEVVVTWHDGWNDPPDDPEETTYCPACGRPDHVVVTWGDALEGGELARKRYEEARRRLRERDL